MAETPVHDLDDVTIIVVTYNSAHCLAELGLSLAECPRIIIADNGSDDGCAAAAKQHLPNAQVIELQRNLGFGTANNRALKQIKTPFALLLNPDCEITPTAIRALMQTAHIYPEAALIAPQLLHADKSPDINYRWPHLLWDSKGPGIQEGPACVGFVCGAAMLFRIEAFDDIGFFDERFFLYYEDDDLCVRLFNAKRAMIIDPAITAVHRSRGSVKGKSPLKSEFIRGYHHAQSKLIFTAKHTRLEQAIAQRKKLIFQTCLALPLRVLLPAPRLIARMYGRLRGVIDWKPHEN